MEKIAEFAYGDACCMKAKRHDLHGYHTIQTAISYLKFAFLLSIFIITQYDCSYY